MHKVKNIFYVEKDPQEVLGGYATGLVLELEDGRMIKQSSTDVIQPFSPVSAEIKEKKQISAHQFKQVYEDLGINLSKLGCVMLDLEPLKNSYSIEVDGAGVALYYAKDKDRFWIDGWVFDKPHITLLYGLLEEAKNYERHIEAVLEGWKMDDVRISHFGYFDSPYEDEPYYCIVAHIELTDQLLEGHQRLQFLPHINTFNTYKAHATVCYLDKRQGEDYRDRLIKQFNDLWAGNVMAISGRNLGGNK